MPEPIRLAVTADLHYDSRGKLTPPELVAAEAERIREAKPDALIIAGDLGHGLDNINACLDAFAGFDVPIGVTWGNHDIWRDKRSGHSSMELWSELLPEALKRVGMVDLEREVMRVGDVGIAGSIAWYDYSAIDPDFKMPRNALVAMKPLVHADAYWIDWHLNDPTFAGLVGEDFNSRLAGLAQDDSLRAIVVVTHVLLLEEQMLRKPGDRAWGVGNAFFGNLTLGEGVLALPKVRAVISGHTHVGREATVERKGMPPIVTHVVPSDYGRPAHVIVAV
jgi:predicted phosphodiesterase